MFVAFAHDIAAVDADIREHSLAEHRQLAPLPRAIAPERKAFDNHAPERPRFHRLPLPFDPSCPIHRALPFHDELTHNMASSDWPSEEKRFVRGRSIAGGLRMARVSR